MATNVRFCSKCNNLLTAKEDRLATKLMLRCTTCDESVEADTNVVYRFALRKKAETKMETVDGSVVSDPTLPRAKDARCVKCGKREAVFFQGDSGRDSDMALVFVCVHCRHKWLG